jgi:hypothetical protein
MKPISIFILCVSLVANAALGFRYFHPNDAAPDYAATTQAEAKAKAGSAQPPAATAAKATPAAKIDLAAVLAGKDNAEIVASLRRAGFPERVILWILGEKVDAEIFRPRNRERRGTDGPLPFWDPKGAMNSQSIAAQLAMQKERRELLKQLVGSEFWDEQNSTQTRTLAFLPPEKVGAVSQIMTDYNDMYSAVRQDMMQAPLPEDKAKLKLLYEERQADLAKVLTPEEMQLYELNTSNTARNLRFSLGGFQPTEAEFRALFTAQKAADEASGSLYGYAGALSDYQARQEAQKTLAEQFKTALGDDRYAEYQRATDYGYQAASKVVQHYNLPAQNATDAYEVQRATLAQAAQIRPGDAQDFQAMKASLTTLAAQASTKLQTLLGPDGFEAYKRSGGIWLRQMERGIPPPTATSMGGGIISFGF